MPKKIKKPISRKPKTKNKNVVNVKINIDNSKINDINTKFKQL